MRKKKRARLAARTDEVTKAQIDAYCRMNDVALSSILEDTVKAVIRVNKDAIKNYMEREKRLTEVNENAIM